MWLSLIVIATFALAFFLLRRRPAVAITGAEKTQMKALPLFTGKWTDGDWSEWRRLMDADLVQISEVEGDFGPSYMLSLTRSGEKLLRD